MSSPFIGEIRLFAGLFAPVNWAFCDGTLIPISQNPTLYQLIGTTYGGDGQQTFALPDLRARVPVHQGGTNVMGQAAGAETVTLTTSQIPGHAHAFMATSSGETASPSNNFPAVVKTSVSGETPFIYGPAGPSVTNLKTNSIKPDGGSQPHNNIQPYLAVNFIIALVGIYPSQ
jgi:microcystin-dependent protein